MDEPETVVEKKPQPGATSSDHAFTETLDSAVATKGSGAPSTTLTTPEALHAEEAEQTRYLIRLGRVMGLGMLALVPFLPGNQTVLAVYAGSVVVAVAVGFWLERVFRDPARYNDRILMFLAVPVALTVFAGVVYVGIFSAACGFIVLGVYFNSRRQGFGLALGAYLATAITQMILAGLVMSGAISDPGLFAFDDVSMAMQLLGQGLIQAVYLGAFLLGVSSHRATVASFERLQTAMRLAAQQGALLNEARQDLDQALQLGGAGRYTGTTCGSFKLGVVIGRGGMGEVYEASHVETEQIAAVKLLHPQSLDDPKHITRFLREVRAVSALNSPHVAQVFEACDPTDAIPFYAMERLFGHDLAEHFRDQRKLTNDGLNKLLNEVGLLLDEARKLGIVHRDLKPRNLFFSGAGDADAIWKVVDFGVATLNEGSGTLTQGHIVGTPAYMSPEQARGDSVDHRADVYAMTAIAYRWLTRRPPFSGKDIPSLLFQVVHAMPERPSLLSNLHRHVDYALAIGLSKRPEDRFDTAPELALAVRSALDGALDPGLQERAIALLANQTWRSGGR